MISSDSQHLESYLPVYDVAPEKWEDARPFFVEQLRKITNAVNTKEIGFFLDEELLSGKAFIPGVNIAADGGSSQIFRTILRKVIDVSPLVAGANSFNHGILFDANFTLFDYWVSATDTPGSTAIKMVYPQVSMTATQVIITSPGNYNRAYFICEYLQEL
jgi:hypothetical protein